ncbi:hypothetical protein QFC22_005050 [Naganishia vaughanmartiniae]|uniref:Uncharacterized protein n=1 Tax=Naganishia vaughanmartiniae TaxID=1424756 RepID=A0ACC2WZF6_9TREE|nr:hypothetical protein QFC22_005050 [Naganishia vaughanmartiniae]
MSVTSATATRHTHTHTHTHSHPHPHRTARRRSAVNLHRTPSHTGTALAGLAALTLSRPSNGGDGMERQDSRSSKASDEVSIVSAPARTRGGSRPGVGGRRKSQVHLAAGDHHAAESQPEEEEWEEEDVTTAAATAAGGHREGGSDDGEDNADESGDGDELVITTKRKRSVAPASQASPSGPPAPHPEPTQDEETLDHQQGRAMRGFDLHPPSSTHSSQTPAVPVHARGRSPSPTSSESGTLIAPSSVPTFTHQPVAQQGPSPARQQGHETLPPTSSNAAEPPSRHLRTRNSHTSLRSLKPASLRTLPSTMMVGPHHPLSSPTSVRTFRVHSGGAGASSSTGLAPPVVSGEIARGLWSTASNGGGAGSSSADIDGLPHSNSPGLSGKRPHAASTSLRKASFSTPASGVAGGSRSASVTSAGSNSGSNSASGGDAGRLSAHSVAQKAARLPTLASRSTAQQDSHERERETVNLVSRFIALPSSASSADSAQKDSSSKGSAGAGGSIFPDSPFATAHRSLVRTMMEESGRLLPIGSNPSTGGYGVGGGISGYHYDGHATSPRLPPSTQRPGISSAMAGTAAGGGNGAMEWVPGLTPFEMSVQRCLEQRKGAVRLATGESLAPLVG